MSVRNPDNIAQWKIFSVQTILDWADTDLLVGFQGSYLINPSTHYRVLHNSLPFSFSKIFVWSCLLWLSVTLSPSTVQRMRADMTPV